MHSPFTTPPRSSRRPLESSTASDRSSSPIALAVRLDPELVAAVSHQLGGRMALASVPHVAAACQAMCKQRVLVVLASSALPFWDRHVLVDRTTKVDVKLCFVPADADASMIVEVLSKTNTRQPSSRTGSRP